ncbi:3-deoxy-7-phosphoheptulonate synthase [Streptomyces sp. NPDC054842]
MTTATHRIRLPAAQQPPWDSEELVETVRADLATLPPLVDAGAVHRLRTELARAARGSAFVLQGGDCAEPFLDSAPPRITAKATQLSQLADLLAAGTALPVTRIGRFAGQYAKPRSRAVETLADGTVLPVYRGDAVNRPAADPAARRPDPARLRAAYDHAASCLDTLLLQGHLTHDTAGSVYTSHEALLVDLEAPLVREDTEAAGHYSSSAHMLWIGERTRQLDGWHIGFAETVNNPVGVKLGPHASPDDVRELCERLTRGHGAGRLSLITRLGATETARRLPALVEAAADFTGRVVWLCDPMHGNTVRHPSGRKTRLLTDMLREITDFFAVLRAHDTPPGGLHLEMTPDDVTECVEDPAGLATDTLPRFRSTCDPRLGPDQARSLLKATADLLARKDTP